MDGHRFLGFEGRQPPGIVVGPARIATRSRIVIPSLARVERTLSVDIAYTTLRMRVLERLAGNRLGIAYRWIDATAVALMSRLPAFCRVIGLRAGHEPHIGPLVRSYRDHDGKPTFEIGPGHYHPSLGRELRQHGLFHSGFHAALAGELPIGEVATAATAVEHVTSFRAMDDYLDA